jgi:MFS family permease
MEDRWLYGWALGYAAVGAASLLIPLYALSLGGDAFLVGVLASTAAFAGVPGALLWGRLAAKTKRRRPFVLVALAATALVLAVTPLIASPWPLVVANASLWLVVAAASPVLNLIMVDGVPETEWESRIGLLNAYQGYGWVVGLVVGTLWTVAAPRLFDSVFAQELLFWVLAGTATLGVMLTRLWYPEPVGISQRRFRHIYRGLDIGPTTGRIMRSVPIGSGRAYWALTSIRRSHLNHLKTPLWRYLGAVACFSVGFAVFWAPMPAYLTDIEFATGVVFVLFLLTNIGSTLCFSRVDSLTSRVGPSTAQVGALVARAVFFPLVALVGSTAFGLPSLGVLFVAIGVTWAVIAVTATGLITRLAPVDDRAEALGIYTAVIGVGAGLGSIAGGAVATRVGYTATFFIAGVIVLFGAGLVAVLNRSAAQGVFLTRI